MRALARIPVESPVLTLVPTAESTALVLEAALNSPTTANQKPDDLYDYAAWLSINDLAKPWTDAIASGAWKADTAERQKQLEWGLKSIDPALAGATLSKLVTDGKVPLDGSGPWIELLGQAGGPRELRKVFNLAVGALPPPKPGSTDVVVADGNYPMRSRALGALIEAARLRNLRPEPLDPRQRGWDKDFLAKHATWTSDDADVQELLDLHSALGGGAPAPNTAAHVELRLRITQLMGYLPRGEAGYLEYRAKEDGAPGIAAAACESLARLGQKAMLREIANEGGNDPSSRRHAIVALASLDAAGALTALPAALPALPDDNERLELWRGVLKAKDFADRLVTEIARDTTPWKNAAPKIGVRAAREAGKNGAKLLAALTPLAGLTASEASVPKDFKALADLAKRDGDPARGEMIYRRAALVCTTCHAIGGAGGKVGPDMTSLGASAPLDYIIESVLEPALKVKEGYNAVAFTLKDGTQATGIQARETAQEFILRDVTGREQAVAKAQIATTTNIGSLMPAGLTNQLADRERLDLFAFLGELGKPGPYDASKGKVARVWWLFPGADADKVVGGQIKWESAFPGYTLVDGRFVKDLLAAAAPLVANGSDTLMAVAQFQAAGKTRLTLTGAAKAWLDGKPLALTEDLAPELSEGVHTLAVKLDVNSLPAHLRAESPNARFLGN